MGARKAVIAVDLGFGDSGKGTIVDFLAHNCGGDCTVVRFNGGAQAAHNVVRPDGCQHTFAQFGSNMLSRRGRTFLSRFVLVDPPALVSEAKHLFRLGCADPFGRLVVDPDCLIVTPFQKAANRLRETLRGKEKHGSCGMGIGETMADSLAWPELLVRARDLSDARVLQRKFAAIQELKLAEFKAKLCGLSKEDFCGSAVECIFDPRAAISFAEEYRRLAGLINLASDGYLRDLLNSETVIFEGAQGVLIDEWYGFHPYTTWSTTTFANADKLIREAEFGGAVEKLGVLRAYFTRHGRGPFPTEDKKLTALVPEIHNCYGRWQEDFRVGWFDLVLARYAIEVCGRVDGLAITNLDRLVVPGRKVATGYDFKGERIERLPVKSALEDLSFQERLTSILENAILIYKTAPEADREYLELLSANLGKPVKIISRGPTVLDKTLTY